MKMNKVYKKKYKVNGIPKIASTTKKEYEQLIALFELHIREYYKQNGIPP